MSARPPRLPLLGRFLLKLTRLGEQRADVEADLTDLFEARKVATGPLRATVRFFADLVSVWCWPLRRWVRDLAAEILYPRRLAAAMLVAGGVIGLVLSCIGLYGVVSYSVAQRMREIGIRTTLGADRRDIVVLVLREGSRVAGIGIVIGFLVAVFVLRVTSGLPCRRSSPRWWCWRVSCPRCAPRAWTLQPC